MGCNNARPVWLIPPFSGPGRGMAWLLAAVLVVALWPSTALAGEEDILFNPVSGRDMDRMVATLGLGDEPSQIARSLYAGYRRDVMDLRAKFREAERARDQDPKQASVDEATRERMEFDALYSFIDRTEALTRAFFDDLRALAGPPLAERVDAAERLYRRRIGTRLPVCSAERADLVAIANDLRVTRSPDFDEVLLDYERRLDDLMKRKLRRVRVLFEELAQAQIRDQPPIFEAIGEVLRKLTIGSLEIRDFNVRQARILRDLLPEAEQAAWTRAFNAKAYPNVHGRDLAADAYAEIRSVDGLSSEQLEAIDRIHERYRTEVTGVDARYIAALNRRHETLAKVNVVAFMNEIDKRPEIDEVKATINDRNLMAQACVRRMLDVLTSEQRRSFKEDPQPWQASDTDDIMPLNDDEDDRGDWSSGE